MTLTPIVEENTMQTYNGYSSYETWLVAVWIDNDQGNIDFWMDVAKHQYNSAEDRKYFTKKEEAIISFGEYMKEYYVDHIPDSDDIGGFWSDMLHAALGSVDWHELAGKYMDQALESVTEKESV
jgi:hypothetical protein